MKQYDAACMNIQCQLNSMLAKRALKDPEFDPYSAEAQEEISSAVAKEVFTMLLGAHARLHTINDHKYDQTQAALREIIRIHSIILGVDVEEKFGMRLNADE